MYTVSYLFLYHAWETSTKWYYRLPACQKCWDYFIPFTTSDPKVGVLSPLVRLKLFFISPLSILLTGIILRMSWMIFPARTLHEGYFMIGCDLLTMLLLANLLKKYNAPYPWLLLYSWNPLIIIHGATDGYPGVMLNLFVATSLWVYEKKNKGKLYAFYFLIFFITYTFLGPGFSGIIPFLEKGDGGCLAKVLRFFLSGSIYHVVYIGLFFAGAFSIWILKTGILAIQYLWLWVVICLPEANFWHLYPLIFFLALVPHRGILALSAGYGVNFYLEFYGYLGDSWWWWMANYLPFFIITLKDMGFSYGKSRIYSPPDSLDIVIPIFNEEKRLGDFLTCLQKAMRYQQKNADNPPGKKWEITTKIILVDGGSSDSTVNIANQYGYPVIRMENASRGQQIAAGFQEGTGDIVLVLHADAMLNEQGLQRLWDGFNQNPGLQWGIMGHVYDTKNIKMRIIEFSNRLRYFTTSIAFGDQGIFVRRCIIPHMPKNRLMEDVELSLRLSSYTCCKNLGGMLKVSTRRWEKKKFTGYTLQVFMLVSSFLVLRRLGFAMETITDIMYSIYYKKDPLPAIPPKKSP